MVQLSSPVTFLVESGFYFTHSGSRHGRHFYSPLNPQQKCPHSFNLSQVFSIRDMQSGERHTSLKAGSREGEGCVSLLKQKRHFFITLNSRCSWQVWPKWKGSALQRGLVQKFFPQLDKGQRTLYLAMHSAASREIGIFEASFTLRSTCP